MFNNLNRAGNPYGVEFAGTDAMFNSQKALLATEYARDHGKLHEFHAEVFKTYFTKGENIAETDRLKAIAAAVGLDPEEMMARVEDKTYRRRLTDAKKDAVRYGVRSIPAFVIDDQVMVVGAQPLEVFRQYLREAEAKRVEGSQQDK